MDQEVLKKANSLNQKIKELTEALNCFEYQPYCDDSRADIRVSTNPRLIIEYDGDGGREQIKLPMNLSDTLVDLLKGIIKKELDVVTMELWML